MANCADLEIGLHRHEADSYAVDFRLTLPESEADTRLGEGAGGKPATLVLDLNALGAPDVDPRAYGETLTRCLFADEKIKGAFGKARTSSQTLNVPLRLRLFVGPSAPELHRVAWETLLDPEDNTPLCAGENLFFSRYLSSLDWRPVRLHPKGDLRALVVAANPEKRKDFPDLKPVDVEKELGRAREGLKGMAITALPEAAQKATLNNLLGLLRSVDFDILYLVCHGSFGKDGPWVWLADDTGPGSPRVSGAALAASIKELQHHPRLVVLVSCQSAGKGEGNVLAALGPRLVEAGIPAVLAMQGDFSMATQDRFMPVFFKELQRHGEIDHALAVARGAACNQGDAWMPTLFMRLKSGRIWYNPGFGVKFDRWPVLISKIDQGECTPILGTGLIEALFGSSRELARRMADNYYYPMAPYERESLTQVAQYVAINQKDPKFPRQELKTCLRQELQRQYDADLPPKLRAPAKVPLEQLVDAVGAKWWEHDQVLPHQKLAELPCPIYITTNSDDLLLTALTEAGKDPHALLCPWNKHILETYPNQKVDWDLSPDHPLVYYLFGRFKDPGTLVVTEDDYFDYLIGVTRNNDLIPDDVRVALAKNMLLFLGFQMDAWDTRIIVRSLMGQEGRQTQVAHIAAQVDPEDDRIQEPSRARDYLEKFFSYGSKNAEISLYWGSAGAFVQELHRRWKAS